MPASWSDLTPLPAPHHKPETLKIGTVRLYEERSWTSNYIEISPGRTHIAHEQHQLKRSNNGSPGNKLKRHGSALRPIRWIAFNFPVGMVMTLTENKCTNGAKLHDMSGCGLSVDLIGQGKTVGVDLEDHVTFGPLAENVQFFSWRMVNFDSGAFELFARTHFRGERVTIYLSDWKPNKDGDIYRYDLRGWSINRKARSIRFKAVDSTTRIYLYGTSSKYDLTNFLGWQEDREVPNLYQHGQHDTNLSLKIGTAFGWGAVSPVKELVEPFEIDERNTFFKIHRIDRCELRNETRDHGKVSHEFAYTTSITKALTATTSVSSAIGLEATAMDPISQSSITVSFQADTVKTETNATTHVEQVEQKRTLTVDAPPHSTRYGRLEVYHCHVQDMKCVVKVRRWYNLKLPDATQDSVDPSLWQRVEHIPISISSRLDGPGFATKSVSILEDHDGDEPSYEFGPHAMYAFMLFGILGISFLLYLGALASRI